MKNVVFVISLLGCLLSSCTTLQTVSFERLQGADVYFPEQIRSVGIINYMPVTETGDESVGYSSDLLEGYGKVAAEFLAQEVAASDYFEKVVICDSALWNKSVPMDDYWKTSVTDSLAQALGVDMLLVLERISIQLKESSVFVPEMLVPVPAIDAAVTPMLKGYVAHRATPVFSVVKCDTICWDVTPALTFAQITKDASEFGAELLAKQLLPHWVEQYRYYFDGSNAEMRDAGVYVREQNWEAAVEIWQKIFSERKGKAKMRAAYNLALSCELKDDFQGAMKYLEEAASIVGEKSSEGALIQLYRIQLEEISDKNKRLKLQMKRFE